MKKYDNRSRKNLIWQTVVIILITIVVNVTATPIVNVKSANIKSTDTLPSKTTVTEAKKVVTSKEKKKPTKTKSENETEVETETETETETELQMEYMGEFTITAYCACTTCCGYNAQGITATGTYVQAGHTVAVDPDVIPLGSEIYIDGNVYVAEDTGVYGNTIDIYMDSHDEALNWGVQYLDVYLVLD